MRKILVTVLMTALFLQSVYFPMPVSQAEEEDGSEASSVISEELQEAFLSDEETYRVMIWMEDIDYDMVESMAETTTATTWEELVACEEQVYADAVSRVASEEVGALGITSTSGLRTSEEIMADSYAKVMTEVDDELKPIAEDVDEFVMAKRTASKALYETNNQELTENSIIAENIIYVSRYSPMIIAELTQEQIEEIAEEDCVVGIYLTSDEMETDEEAGEISDIQEEVSEEYGVTATSTDYDGYLDYLSATPAHAMGYTGDGVKVGVIDASAVTNVGHNELAGSSVVAIYNEGSPMEPDLNLEHSVEMVRIICGDYGMAPDCQVYSITRLINVCDGIETLLDRGVSVINMSISYERASSLYTAFEMWIDHVAVSHGVVVTVAAGNYTNYESYNITQPGLAYNVITVANVDYTNDEINNKSCYINGSSGAMKPDVASAGANVLGDEYGGTSAATATVTGMIAILLEVKPTLKGSPYLIKAIVIASADHIAGSDTFSSCYSSKQGAGVVNVMRAITIINRGQYWSNYISSNGTYTYTKTVASGSSTSSFVLVGMKMNVPTGSHGEDEYNNQDMPSTQLVIFNTSGIGLNGCAMPYSSVQVARTSYNSTVQIRITVSNIGNRGMPYAVAWY